MGYFVEKLLKAFAIPVAVGVTCAPAQSRSLQVLGTAGYLSEWELNGTVMEKSPAGSNEFSGALIWKHVGLCSVNGPQEKFGEIRLQISGSDSSARVNGVFSFDGARCVYSGEFSGVANGYMDCPDAKGVPLSISIR